MVEYPKDWILDKVENIADITTGSRDTQDNQPGGRYPFFVRSQIVERINVAINQWSISWHENKKGFCIAVGEI